MSTLVEIERAIEDLSREDFRQLHRWISERDADQWDDEIVRDAAAGKFDQLRDRVLGDYKKGLCTDL